MMSQLELPLHKINVDQVQSQTIVSPSEVTHYFPSVATTKQQYAPDMTLMETIGPKTKKHDKMYYSRDFQQNTQQDFPTKE